MIPEYNPSKNLPAIRNKTHIEVLWEMFFKYMDTWIRLNNALEKSKRNDK